MSPDLQLPSLIGLPARGTLRRAIALVLLAVFCADLCLWGVGRIGLGLPVAMLVAAGLALASVADVRHRAVWWGLLGLLLSALPAVEAVKPASVLVLMAGGAWFAGCLIVAAGAGRAVTAALAFPILALTQWLWDIILAVETAVAIGRRPATHAVWQDWVLPLGLGAIFIWLLTAANPLLRIDLAVWPAGLTALRMAFWLLLAAVIWPVLRTSAMAGRLAGWPALPAVNPQFANAVVSERSVLRSLILFNGIFAVQTATDVAFLWGGTALPDGMTFAAYAHRGAYPLVATALLAGVFALIAQPHLAGRTMKLLLIGWVAQNLGLVVSSLLRLDLYVQTYGLTHLRVAAFVWMAIVAAGLLLMLWQMSRRLPVTWMITRSLLMGAFTLWLVAFVNVDGLIARVNLSGENPGKDPGYVCTLGTGAIPALADYHTATGRDPCAGLTPPHLTPPQDWREWGFRNQRILSSLTQTIGDIS